MIEFRNGKGLGKMWTALDRPRCRIACGEPSESGFVWDTVEPLPSPTPVNPALSLVAPCTTVRALAAETKLHVHVRCDAEPARLTPAVLADTLAAVEHAFIEVMPDNHPGRRFRFAADFRGMKEAQGITWMSGEAHLGGVYETWRETTPVTGDWHRHMGVDGSGWWVEMIVPWALMGLPARPAVIGLSYGRQYQTGQAWPVFASVAWPATKRPSCGHVELEPGEALLGDAGAPAGLRIDAPVLGTNTARLLIGDDWPMRPTRLRVRTCGPAAQEPPAIEKPIPDIAPHVDFQFRIEREWSSYLEPFRCPELSLELLTKSGRVLYHASLPMDRHVGIPLDERYGQEAMVGGEAGDSRDAWVNRIAPRLPRLLRRTTVDGAPSDFCLTREDGTLVANLIADDAWRRLAELVQSLFRTAEERLVGAMLLVAQKSVTNLVLQNAFYDTRWRHTYHTPLHEAMGPLSLLRFGGGTAPCRAAVLAQLLQNIEDPSTHKPFVTRVICLTREGGPEQVRRRFTNNKNLSGFVQNPAPIGVVTVDYKDSQTLLDPTSLTFFPTDEKILATVEQVTSDSVLRMNGAGRLAEAFARLDIEELRRHRPNTMLSRGVFPELCPNEEGSDRRFELGQKQTPPVLIAPPEGAAEINGFRTAAGRQAMRNGDIQVRWHEDGLEVWVRVRGVDTLAMDDSDRDFECVHVCIDPTHGHHRFHHFTASLAGDRNGWIEEASGIQTMYKNLSTENWTEKAAVDPSRWGATVTTKDAGYEAAFGLSWESLNLTPDQVKPSVIGLNVWIEGRFPTYEQVFLAPPRWRLPADPFSFADVYLSAAPAVIQELDLGVPTWGKNVARVKIASMSSRPVEVSLACRTTLALERRCHEMPPTTVNMSPRDVTTVDVSYMLDPSEKMIAGGHQKVTLVMTSLGKELASLTLPVTYCGPVSVYPRYGRNIGAVTLPDPSDPTYLDKKGQMICARLPGFRRLTTRDGAAGDFIIRAEDNSVEFNLMKPGVLDEMAGYVAGRYDNDVDRVLGVFHLSRDPAVARHMSFGHQVMGGAGPLSVMRGNFTGAGGNCGYHARVFAGLMSHLKIAGQAVPAKTVGTWGHVIAAFGWRGDWVLVDPDVGHVMMLPDASDFVTMDEFLANPSIACTASPGERARFLHMNPAFVRLAPSIRDDGFLGVFPVGAPIA